MVDSCKAEPLYVQLKNQLLMNINSGVYARGQKIPTESELVQQFSVSRITVRRALDELEKSGLLVRHQGKGTFVSDQPLRRDISRNSSFTRICEATGLVPGARTIKCVFEDANADDLRDLKLQEGDKVISMERIRYADNVPVSIEFSRFPESFSFLIEEDLYNSSLIALLASKYNIQFTSTSTKTLRLVYATYEQAKYLDTPKGYPLISITCVSYDSNGAPCQRSHQLIVGDRFELYF